MARGNKVNNQKPYSSFNRSTCNPIRYPCLSLPQHPLFFGDHLKPGGGKNKKIFRQVMCELVLEVFVGQPAEWVYEAHSPGVDDRHPSVIRNKFQVRYGNDEAKHVTGFGLDGLCGEFNDGWVCATLEAICVIHTLVTTVAP